MVFGPVDSPRRGSRYAEAGQEIWFRLGPGGYAFSVVPEDGFRARLAHGPGGGLRLRPAGRPERSCPGIP